MIRRLRESAREFFFRKNAERQSSAIAPAQLSAMRIYHRAAAHRMQVARDLRGTGRSPVALDLHRNAALLFILSYFVSRGEKLDEKISLREAFGRLEAVLAGDGVSIPPLPARARPLLVSDDLLELDRTRPAEAIRRIEELDELVSYLATLTETRSTAQFRFERIVRVGAAAAALVAALVWIGIKILSPRNLALHKPVTASGESYGTTPAGAVDGDKSGTFDFHSTQSDSPWLAIDLQQPYAIDRVKVFGRGECCYDQSVPLALEVSDDGSAYRKVAGRADPFSERNPWVVNGVGTARYVRVRSERNTVLVLSEVEVNGRKPK
jgi:hypothetical protein